MPPLFCLCFHCTPRPRVVIFSLIIVQLDFFFAQLALVQLAELTGEKLHVTVNQAVGETVPPPSE